MTFCKRRRQCLRPICLFARRALMFGAMGHNNPNCSIGILIHLFEAHGAITEALFVIEGWNRHDSLLGVEHARTLSRIWDKEARLCGNNSLFLFGHGMSVSSWKSGL